MVADLRTDFRDSMNCDLLLSREGLCFVRLREICADRIAQDAVENLLSARLRQISEAGRIPVIDAGEFDVADGRSLFDVLSAEFQAREVSRLIIVGGWLEGAMTRLCLRALMDGFDVFVAADLTASQEPDYTAHFYARLRNHGGVIVTSRQIAMELLDQEADQEAARGLVSYLEEHAGDS